MVRNNTTIGYVILPADVDAAEYIVKCKRTGQFCVLSENNEFHLDVRCSTQFISHIEIPNVVGELGTCVILQNVLPHNIPIITGTLLKTDEVYPYINNQQAIQSNIGPKSSIISVLGDIVVTEVNTDGSGKIRVKLSDTSISSSYEIEVDGKYLVEAVKIGLLAEEISASVKDLTITIKDGEIAIGADTQPTVKGNDLLSQLNMLKSNFEILTKAITTAVPIPSDGGAAIKTALTSAIQTMQSPSFDKKLLSKKCNVE